MKEHTTFELEALVAKANQERADYIKALFSSAAAKIAASFAKLTSRRSEAFNKGLKHRAAH